MKRCKHQTGYLVEIMSATHTRDVINGVMNEIGHNEVENIRGYLYHCVLCGREFSYDARPHQKWLQVIHDQLATSY